MDSHLKRVLVILLHRDHHVDTVDLDLTSPHHMSSFASLPPTCASAAITGFFSPELRWTVRGPHSFLFHLHLAMVLKAIELSCTQSLRVLPFCHGRNDASGPTDRHPTGRMEVPAEFHVSRSELEGAEEEESGGEGGRGLAGRERRRRIRQQRRRILHSTTTV